MRTKRNASCLGGAGEALRKGKALGAPGGPYGRPKSRVRPGGWQEGATECVVMHFEARGLEESLEAWGCVEAGGAGDGWDRGGAARSPGPRKFSRLPQGTQGIGFAGGFRHTPRPPKHPKTSTRGP